MTLEECYNNFGGNYRDVLKRLRKEERVERYLKSFPTQDMITPIEKDLSLKDYRQAFLDSHELKGLCATLSLSKLYNSVSILTDCLREDELKGDPCELLEIVKKDYNKTIEEIKKL